jgi:hypothetical protein
MVVLALSCSGCITYAVTSCTSFEIVVDMVRERPRDAFIHAERLTDGSVRLDYFARFTGYGQHGRRAKHEVALSEAQVPPVLKDSLARDSYAVRLGSYRGEPAIFVDRRSLAARGEQREALEKLRKSMEKDETEYVIRRSVTIPAALLLSDRFVHRPNSHPASAQSRRRAMARDNSHLRVLPGIPERFRFPNDRYYGVAGVMEWHAPPLHQGGAPRCVPIVFRGGEFSWMYTRQPIVPGLLQLAALPFAVAADIVLLPLEITLFAGVYGYTYVKG